MFESRMLAIFGNGDFIEENYSDNIFPVPFAKPQKQKRPYKEVEVAPWYGKAQNMERAINDYLAKQMQRGYEFVKKDFNFKGMFLIVTKNKKHRIKETRKFYAR